MCTAMFYLSQDHTAFLSFESFKAVSSAWVTEAVLPLAGPRPIFRPGNQQNVTFAIYRLVSKKLLVQTYKKIPKNIQQMKRNLIKKIL